MAMDSSSLVRLLIEYRWWILIPLSVLESTVVAFVAGLLAAAGYFTVYVLWLYFFARDMIIDLGLYGLGRWVRHAGWTRSMLVRLHIAPERLDSVRAHWNEHPARTMFIGKFSYGVAATFIIVAGMVRMSLRKFLGYGALAAVAEYSLYLGSGYFFGASLGGNIVTIIDNVQYVVLGGSALLIAYYWFARHIRRRMRQSHEQICRGRPAE
jgi:membrane protein DedA with SNARE-associated domain